MFFQSVENCHRFPAFSYPRVLHSALSMNREWEVVKGRGREKGHHASE